MLKKLAGADQARWRNRLKIRWRTGRLRCDSQAKRPLKGGKVKRRPYTLIQLCQRLKHRQ